ncbi:hypothetical protein WI25_01460 [Burkholderia cepacia]|uniref:hypothetical protein n=1 Tax=Burkholderia cepacia TaxID=292 RepID=UPI00075C0373|nr:hypothetical protein [Burkholderia cepacia]KUY74569.1 hypothetical protein WI25_01460 [Burkholderia cepacia]
MIIIAWWCFGTFAFLVAFWFERKITISDMACAIGCGCFWPLFLAIYLLARYGDRVVWRRK